MSEKLPKSSKSPLPETLPPSIFPARFQILSGSMLKLIACIAMLIDHTGAIILSRYQPALMNLFYINGKGISAYRIVRDIGRCAFPIFCFLIVEGFLHTHDRRKYGQNLLLFALISEIPWNFMFANTWHYADKQNVFFTLFLGYLASVPLNISGKHHGYNLPLFWHCLVSLSYYMQITDGGALFFSF